MPIRTGRNSTSSSSRPTHARDMARPTNSNVIRNAVALNIAKSTKGLIVPLDDIRDFKTGLLPNYMKYTVVSEPGTDEAAIALRVNVGSYSDPKDWQGTAHATEHDVFISSAKYAEVDTLTNLTGRWGGATNAYTSDMETVYEVEILDPSEGRELYNGRPKLQHTLDVFSSLFIAPTFDPRYVDKERNAVHDEYALKELDPYRRCRAVLFQVINQNHPSAHFGSGNKHSLADGPGRDLRTVVSNFFDQHYSAAEMHISVVGPQPVPTLERWVQETMSQVQLLEREHPDYATEPLFPVGMKSQFVQVRSEDNSRHLTLWFQTKDFNTYKQTSPEWIIQSVLQDKRQGSLYSMMADKNWIKNIRVQSESNDGKRSLLGINLELRKEGFRQYKNVTKTVFAYLDFMSKNLSTSYVADKYREGREQNQDHWLTGGKLSALDTALKLVENTTRYNYSDLLIEDTMLNQDIMETQHILSDLKPNKMISILSAPRLVTDKLEPWYSVGYKVNKLPDADVETYSRARLGEGARLPGLNPYIASNVVKYSDRAHTREVPAIRHKSHGFEVWSMPKVFANATKAHYRIALKNAVLFNGPKDQACMAVYLRLIRNSLTKYDTLSKDASQRFSVVGREFGFDIALDGKGYSRKQMDLLDRIFRTIHHVQPDQDTVNMHIEEMRESIENSLSKGIDSLMAQEEDTILVPGELSDEALYNTLNNIEPRDVIRFIRNFMNGPEVLSFIHGNISDESVQSFANMINQNVTLPQGAIVEPEKILLKLDQQYVHSVNSDFYFAKNDRINGYQHTFLAHGQSVKEHAAFAIISQMMDKAFFSEARTENQVGYSLGVLPTKNGAYGGLTFVANSSNKSVPEIHEICNSFLLGFLSTFDQMSQEEFDGYKENLLHELGYSGKSSETVANMHWGMLNREKAFGQKSYTFNLKDAIEDISINRVKRIFEEQMFSEPHSLLTFMDKNNTNWRPADFEII
tara:strand:+ start:23601 stop:26525 length:2925 start_codon:yes stop_codon:yes gene_type:complete